MLAERGGHAEQLAELGVAMAVCTNKPTVFSKKILDFLGAVALLPRHRRPRRRGRAQARRAASAGDAGVGDCAPEQALFVGDMPLDVHAARNSGMDVAVVATGSSTREQLVPDAEPDHFLGKRFSGSGIECRGALRSSPSSGSG